MTTMTRDVAIGARITEELDERLRRLAEASGRSKSGVVAEAVQTYVEAEMEFIEEVEEGLRARDAGDVVEHAAVVEDFARRKQLGRASWWEREGQKG